MRLRADSSVSQQGIALTAAHDIDIRFGLVMVQDAISVSQRVRQHLELYLGEDVYRPDAGVDWHGLVFVEPFDPELAAAVVKEAVASVPGVTQITEFSLDPLARPGAYSVQKLAILTVYDEIEVVI